MSFPARLHRPLAAAVLGLALLAPLQPTAASATPTTTHKTHTKVRTTTAHPTATTKHAGRATRATLAAYGDTDASGAIHLSGSLRWSNGKALGHRQRVELWGRSGKRWVLLRTAVTDRRGDVELSVTPSTHTRYRLRYAGSRSARLSSVARASVSSSVQVHAVAHLALKTPGKAHRGSTFVVTGKVAPGGAGRLLILAGNGRTFTTLTTRADGSFSAHVRLRMTTTLSVVLPDTASLDGTVSGPHRVRVG